MALPGLGRLCRTISLAAAIVMAAAPLALAEEAEAKDMPSPENSGAANYKHPVPPDLPQRQLEAKQRLQEEQARQRAQTKPQTVEEAPAPERPAATVPLPGYMYH